MTPKMKTVDCLLLIGKQPSVENNIKMTQWVEGGFSPPRLFFLSASISVGNRVTKSGNFAENFIFCICADAS